MVQECPNLRSDGPNLTLWGGFELKQGQNLAVQSGRRENLAPEMKTYGKKWANSHHYFALLSACFFFFLWQTKMRFWLLLFFLSPQRHGIMKGGLETQSFPTMDLHGRCPLARFEARATHRSPALKNDADKVLGSLAWKSGSLEGSRTPAECRQTPKWVLSFLFGDPNGWISFWLSSKTNQHKRYLKRRKTSTGMPF